MAQIDFVMTNPRHHLAMFAPVIRHLGAAGLSVRVLSLCELRGYRTPAAEVAALGAASRRLMPVRLSKDSPVRVVRQRAAGRLRRWFQEAVWTAGVQWRRRVGPPRSALAVLPNDVAFPYDRIAQVYTDDGVPFLLMQEGIRFDLPAGRGRRQYGQGGARAIAAWGQASVRHFQSLGVPPDRIHAVGNPRLDAIVAGDWSVQTRRLRGALGITDRAVLILTNPVDLQGFCSADDKYRMVTAFLDAAAPVFARHDLPAVIKIHPSESLPAYRALAAASAAGPRVIRDADPYALFPMAAAVIIAGSTAGLEAMLFDRPVGALEVPGAGFLHDYVDTGAAVPLAVGAAGAGLEELLSDPPPRRDARRRYLADQVANLGASAAAAAALVRSLVAERAGVPA